MAAKNKSTNKKDPVSSVIYYTLSLMKHWRMMSLLAIFSFSLGLVYLSYARRVYETRGLVRYNFFNFEVQDGSYDGSLRRNQTFFWTRSLLMRLNSEYLIKKTAERLGLIAPSDNYVDVRAFALPAVRVESLSDGLLSIYVQSYKPGVGRKAIETLVSIFNEEQHKLKKERQSQQLDLYREELEALSSKVSRSFKQSSEYLRESSMMESFIEQNQLTEVPREMIGIKHRLAKMEQVKGMLNDRSLDDVAKLSIISTFEKEPLLKVGQILPASMLDKHAPLKAPTVQPATNLSVVVDPATVGGLQPWEKLEIELRKTKEEISRQSGTYLPGHPLMEELINRRDQLALQLEEELKRAKRRFQLEELNSRERLQQLQTQLPEYQQVLNDYETFLQKFELLRKEKEIWWQTYQRLQQRINAIDFEGDKEKVQVAFDGLISEPDKPIAGNKRKIFLASLALALGLSVGLSLGIDKLKDAGMRIDDLEDRIALNGLGIIPLTDKMKLETIVRDEETDAAVPDFLLENFRIVRSGIAFNQGTDVPTQVIMVSSARPGEGKTSISANLAWSFAKIGERTLLVDADLRRGRQHDVFDFPNEVGLTQVLMGEARLDDAILHTRVEGLDVIPRGNIITGANERLCSPEFDELIGSCRRHYDRIIIDTPPILGLSETISLQRLVDGVVLVVKAGDTPVRLARESADLIRKAGGRLFGFILNRIDFSKSSNLYSYFYYSSAYYTQDEK